MSYVALYREWRPKTFIDLIGQHHVSQTLRNAITSGRIAHAYLFCGPRGTGKTSTAKVLAKAMNCINGPTPEPCNHCQSCEKINQGTSLDVLEIDAASNRGIDEIRDLREKVKLAATEGNFKVYIIDEVHMLTTEAFNALLKTLEEPPSHVIFILATTEPHKIPATILSRCQRFDFRRIGIRDMLERLQYIAEREDLTISPEALALIIRGAEGGMRDALSILDQCISYSGKTISEEDVMSVMGTVGQEALEKIARAILSKQFLPGFEVINELFEKGKEVRQFNKDLVEYFRQLLLAKVCEEPGSIIEATGSTLESLKVLSKEFTRSKLIQVIDSFTDAEKEMKWTTQPRLLLELALIKCLDEQDSGSLNTLLERISALEEKIANHSAAVVTSSGPAPKQPTTQGWAVFVNEGVNPEPASVDAKEENVVTPGTKVTKNEDVIQAVSNPAGLEKIQAGWKEFLEFFKTCRKVSLHAVMVEGEPVTLNGNILTISFKYPFHKDRVEMAENKKAIEEILKKFFGTAYTIKTVLHQEKQAAVESKESKSLIEEAIHLFGGDVIEIND